VREHTDGLRQTVVVSPIDSVGEAFDVHNRTDRPAQVRAVRVESEEPARESIP